MDPENIKSPVPCSSKQNNEASQSNGSKAVDLHGILDASKFSQEKPDNSHINDHENDPKPTPRSSFLKSDGYRLNILNIIQSSLFKGDNFGSPMIDKELPVQHKELKEVEERNSFIQLSIFPSNSESNEDEDSGPEELNRLPVQTSPANRENNNPTILLEGIEMNENRSQNEVVPGPNLQSPPVPVVNQQQQPLPNHQPIQNNNQIQEASVQEEEPGINPKILRHIEFYSITFVCYIFAYIITAKYVKIEVIFAVVTPLLLYYIMKVVKKKQPETLTIRQKRARWFEVASLVFLTIYVIVGGIKIKYSQYSLAPAVIPGFLNIFAWLFFSDTVGYSSFCSKKVKIFFKQVVWWTQLLLIGLRADDKMSKWSSAFSLTYYLLFAFIFYSILVFFIFLSALFGCRRGDSSYKLNIIGFAWYLIVSLYSWIWFIIVLNAGNFLDDESSKNTLLNSYLGAIAHSLFLLFYAIFLRHPLTRFLRFETNLFVARMNQSSQGRVEKTVRFEVEQGDMPYLAVISPTFYLQMQEAFRLHNKTSLLNWIKDIKLEKFKMYMRMQPKACCKNKHEKLEIKDLTMPENVTNRLNYSKNFVILERKKENICSTSMINLNRCLDSPEQNNSKIFYSFDDMAIYNNIKKPEGAQVQVPQKENENEKICYICFERAPNAVFMKCGHGGVCYECAIESWKKADTCLMCRQKVEAILKVSIIDKLKVSKVIHTTKKIVENTPINVR